jgi:enolase
MMMLTAALLIILSMPVCASVAGAFVWVAHRNETADDSELLQHFLVALIVAMAILWGISRTDAVRMRLNPQLRIEAEIKKNAVYAAVDQFAPIEVSLGPCRC